ncbi:MAG: VWA domain-containing protein [Candidatus Thorarchaeota archaeon]|nr:VWA domain-containing protein [Candidatus Thorarchaeota archaeon]
MPMLKTSSESFPASKRIMSDIPYVLRVEFRDLARDVKKITGKPIACYKCGGYLLSVDQIEDDPKVGKHFVCGFCGTLNVIEGEVIVAGYDTDFVVTPPPDKTETTTDMVAAGGRSFLALIDVSGSMAGANLAAVKRSLNTSIDSMAANSPNTLFGLIEFESSVLFRDMETGEAIELPADSFHNLDTVMTSAKKLLDRIKMVPVGKNSAKLKKHVKALRDQGGTALGPTVGMAYVLAKHRNVDRVVLLTDGLANEGIGALEGFQVTPATNYYENMGHMYREIGTALDVVGIASISGMELKTLGLLPEATGGQMYYVKPNELDRSLSDLAGASLLGRDVEVKLITPLGVKIKDASGVSRAVIEDFQKRNEGKIGVVGENHELYFQIEPEGELKVEEIPVQVQVTYTDEEGARRVRAVTTKLKVVKKEAELFETLDPTVGATFVTQKAGEDAFRGDRARGKSRITAFRTALKKRAGIAPKAVQSKLNKVESALASEEAEMERQEAQMKEVSEAAPSAAADEVSTLNLAQMKRSSKDLFEDEE